MCEGQVQEMRLEHRLEPTGKGLSSKEARFGSGQKEF
jgi:hypothetical protein